MKIAVVRGAFANPYELQNFEVLNKKFDVTVFASKENRFRVKPGMTLEKLFSPYDYMGRYARGVFNRLFVDSHHLFGLENSLKGFDIAHTAETYYGYTQQCLNAKRKGYIKKVVCTVWENIAFNNESIRGRKEFKKRAFAEVDLFLPVTQQAKEALIAEGCDSKKIQVLMPGIDLERFKPREIPKQVRDDTPTVLYVGRNVPEKGVSDLSGVKIVSNTPYELMPEVYKDASILVLPSRETATWKEQYGMVLLEAMASGLPIVTTGTGAIREVVGDAGIYTDAKNLKNILEKLVTDKPERERRGKMSRSRAEKYFDRNIFTKKLEKIYERSLKTN